MIAELLRSDPCPSPSDPRPSPLIVDDHEAIRRELRRLFQSQPDFTVCGEAVDGADAISKAQQLSPDLVILDLAMLENEWAGSSRCPPIHGTGRYLLPRNHAIPLRVRSLHWGHAALTVELGL
jgi:CheY-like chemotaxis protein